MEFFNFRLLPEEGPDECIARYEMTRVRSNEVAGLVLSWVGYAFLLLRTMGIPNHHLPPLIDPARRVAAHR